MPIGGFGGFGGGVINAPGKPYNGQNIMQVMQGLNQQAQSPDPAVRAKAVQDLQDIGSLPQFKGFGWEGLAAFAATVGLGSLVHAAQGGAAAGTTGGTTAGGTVGGTMDPSNPDWQGPVQTAGGSGGGGVTGLLDNIFSAKNIPDLLSGGLAIVNGVLTRKAAIDAAEAQAGAADRSAQLQADTAKNALDFAKQVYGDQQTANKPFLVAGTNALGEVQRLIQPGGELSRDYVAPTAEEVRQTPGYQLQLDEALKALKRQTRGITSGATVKAAERFAADYADTKYDTANNRNLNIFQTNRSNRLNPLLTLAGYGPQAVAQNNQTGNSLVNANTGITTQTAQNIGNLGQESAFQRSSGSVAGSNALTEALTQIANLAQQRAALNRSSV